MSGQYTPGPWELGSAGISSKDGYADILYAQDGHVYSEVTSDPASLEIPNPANIALIIAAPDLLEALEAIVALCDASLRPGGGGIVPSSARAAIAKARGQ